MSHIQPLTLSNKRSALAFADLVNVITQAKRERHSGVKIEVKQDWWNNTDHNALPRLEVAIGVTTLGRECIHKAERKVKQLPC